MTISATPHDIPPSTSGEEPLAVADTAARSAGRAMMDRFHTHKEVRFKGRGNLVTDVDLASERAILNVLRQEYPGFGLVSEESDPIRTGSPFSWVIDPLDGTKNYASGIPHFSVVVALAWQGQPVLGVTYDPVRNEMFSAHTGRGAFLNGVPIKVSDVREVPQSLLGFDMGYVDEWGTRALDMLRTLWPNMQGMRLMGSGALGLAYAACGRVDLYFHHRLYPWDIASGLVLVREAGGTVLDRAGEPCGLESPSVIAANPALVQSFLEATEDLEWRRG